MSVETTVDGRQNEFRMLLKQLRQNWKLYSKNKGGILGLTTLAAFSVMAILSQYIVPFNPLDTSKWYGCQSFSPPSWVGKVEGCGLMGADELGRDVFAQVINGARASLMVGLLATAVASTIGLVVGLLSGYLSGKIDNTLMRFSDLILTIPPLPLLIVITAILGAQEWNVILLVSALWWPQTARLIRSRVLSIKERGFIRATQALGASDLYTIRRHILPNVFPLMIPTVVIMISGAILLEAGLSFLGLSDPLVVSWGWIMHNALTSGAIISGAWWYFLSPGVLLSALVLSFTLIGNSLDEIVNPKIREVT